MSISTTSIKAILLASVSASLLSGTAFAQSSNGLDEVIVTAQKRAENQQDVPISVATMNGDQFSALQLGGEDIMALAARVPGVYAESSNGRLAPRFYIRGLGNVDFDVAASQPVSIIIDDVVQENVLFKSNPIYDSEQVEVLRGPQGTLFGRNTPAGIIKFDSRRPSHEAGGNAKLSMGSFGTIHSEVGVGGSIVEDKVAARVSGLYRKRNNYIDNVTLGTTGDDLGRYEEVAGRLQLLFTPSDNVDLLLNAHGRSLNGTAAVFRANIIKPGGGFASHFDRRQVYFDGGNSNQQTGDTYGFSGKLNVDFGGITLTSITAYEGGKSSSVGDIDGGTIVAGLGATVPNGLPSGQTDTSFPPDGILDATTFPGFIPFAAETQDSLDNLKQFTQELRIASNGAGPLNWQAGFYYFDTDFNVITEGPAFPPRTVVHHGNDTWAVFGQASYDVSDQLTLTGGLRYTDDNRQFDAPSPPPGPTVNPTAVSDNDLSWDISALYRATDTTNLYARVARGFRGPTIQGRDVAFSAFNFGAVDPQTVAQSETIQSYEVGFKSELMDNRMRLNAATYYYKIDNQQFSIIGGATNSNQVINADQGVGYGFETDLEWLVTDNFFVQAGFAYNHTEIQDATLATATCGSGQCTPTDPLNALGQALIDGNPFPNAPKLTLNVFAEYTMPLANGGELFFNTDWAVQGETHFLLYTTPEFQSSGNFEGGLQAGYRAEDGRYSAALFVRNVTDEVNLKGGIDFNNNTGFVNEPRVIGVALSADF